MTISKKINGLNCRTTANESGYELLKNYKNTNTFELAMPATSLTAKYTTPTTSSPQTNIEVNVNNNKSKKTTANALNLKMNKMLPTKSMKYEKLKNQLPQQKQTTQQQQQQQQEEQQNASLFHTKAVNKIYNNNESDWTKQISTAVGTSSTNSNSPASSPSSTATTTTRTIRTTAAVSPTQKQRSRSGSYSAATEEEMTFQGKNNKTATENGDQLVNEYEAAHSKKSNNNNRYEQQQTHEQNEPESHWQWQRQWQHTNQYPHHEQAQHLLATNKQKNAVFATAHCSNSSSISSSSSGNKNSCNGKNFGNGSVIAINGLHETTATIGNSVNCFNNESSRNISATSLLLPATAIVQSPTISSTSSLLTTQSLSPASLATASAFASASSVPSASAAATATVSASSAADSNTTLIFASTSGVNFGNSSTSSLLSHVSSSSSSSSSTSSSCSLSPTSPASSSSSPFGSAFASSAAACNCCSNLIARCCFGIPLLKAINVRRCVLALLAITVVTIFYYTHYVDTGVFVGLIQRDTRPSPLINCRMVNGKHIRGASPAPDHRSEARLRIDPKVLVFVETTYTGLGRDIAELLVYNRIKYKIEVAGKSLPVLTNLDKGRYGVIVFENLDKYLHMDKWNRELLDKYCREYSVGVVGFVSPSEETLVAAQLRNFPLFVHTNLRLRDASLNPASPVLRLTRAGETAWGALPGDDWAVFQHNHSTYEPIEWAQRNPQDYPSDSGGQVQLPLTTVLQDHGQLDGIQRVLFGSSLRFWLHRLLFLDALSYLSHGQLSLSLDRMILVDIDDIFVGEKGTRLRPDDVRALIATQKIMSSMVPGFRFNLGFSGKYYHHGTREENLGDDFLLQNVHEFNWFSHMWKHQQPHLYDNLTMLMSEMQLNYGFAKEHNIPTDSGYSISPHHSGVYPAHEILYVAWKKVWNVKVTSTEEYPHLRPARLRRGFIHRNIMVLPRQTCGLFTHTMYIDRYPGGRDKLDESIQGGELFQTIVYNPINIFMTHMSNYGSDRLALYTFQSVIKFLQCWTNLRLASAPPVQLAEMYFRLHPEEVDPVWGNPCDEVRHKKIWSKTKSCDSLPKFLVIGPQKTGTTALYTFLSMHSSIASNVPSPDTFEELQFFNGNNYYRGLDWYMNFFPVENNTTTRYLFEKSATYFDGEMVPKRAHALLPHAKIVTILISPAKRAYSWYQHQRAHGDIIANNYSFYQVITATDSAPKSLKDLRNRCLNPGKYAQHLEHWLAYYPAQQLHIIDGEQLRLNPVDVMNDLQRFLKIQPPFDYSNHLRFDTKKGFFCQIVNEKRNKCLGKSKGRQYATMDDRSAKLLQRYYLSYNTALVKLLKKLGSRPIPQWLKDDLSTGT